MGFFCYDCNKKVRGQPVNHGCTKRKYGKNANNRVHMGPGPPRTRTACFTWLDTGYCPKKGKNCAFIHKKSARDPRSKEVREKRRKQVRATTCPEWGRTKSCSRGPQCKYRHPGSRNCIPQICFNWRDTGSCSRGSRCRYLHDANAPDPATHMICFEWRDTGSCSKGTNCAYMHNDADDPESTSATTRQNDAEEDGLPFDNALDSENKDAAIASGSTETC